MLERIKKIFIETTGNSIIEISEGTMLKNDLELSSFDLAQLASEIEEEFNVEIPNRALKDFITVGDVIDFLEKNSSS